MKVKFYSALPTAWIFMLSFLIANAAFSNTSRVIDINNFTGINLAASYTVHLSQGNKQKVRVEGDATLISELSTTVKDGIWVIKNKNKSNKNSWNSSKGKLDIYITLPQLTSLSVTGSGLIDSGTFSTDDLNVAISGSGSIKLPVRGDNISARISGSGDMKLSGSASTIAIAISGSGNVKAINLKAGTAKVSIAGSGNAYVNTNSDLEVSIAGSGSVRYKGSPNISKRIAGSGKVSRAK